VRARQAWLSPLRRIIHTYMPSTGPYHMGRGGYRWVSSIGGQETPGLQTFYVVGNPHTSIGQATNPMKSSIRPGPDFIEKIGSPSTKMHGSWRSPPGFVADEFCETAPAPWAVAMRAMTAINNRYAASSLGNSFTSPMSESFARRPLSVTNARCWTLDGPSLEADLAYSPPEVPGDRILTVTKTSSSRNNFPAVPHPPAPQTAVTSPTTYAPKTGPFRCGTDRAAMSIRPHISSPMQPTFSPETPRTIQYAGIYNSNPVKDALAWSPGPGRNRDREGW